MPSMIKQTAVLAVVTVVAAFLLGWVYEVTKEPIAQQKAKREADTVALLLPATEETRSEIVETPGATVQRVITCLSGGEVIGYALVAAPKGYSGPVQIMVGLDTDGVIQGLQILSHAETPGLGANAALPGFTDQFIGKRGGALTVAKASGADAIDAVTSATITSNAVTAGVNAAADYFNLYIKAGA